MFSVSNERAPIDAAGDAAGFCGRLHDILPKYDLVVAADYGHGMLSANAIETLCNRAVPRSQHAVERRNHGFNMISKYPRADYVCLAQREVALETRNQQLTGEEMAEHVSAKLIARGDDHSGQRRHPLLHDTRPVRPRPGVGHESGGSHGAGDAVLCVTAQRRRSATPEITAFIGNVVARKP